MQIAVIAKSPVPGRVKTRLCPPCTPVEAARLAEAALRDTLATVISTRAARHVLVLDGEPGPWVPDGFDVVEQRGDGLGSRLACAFTDCFSVADDPVVLVGMDTPQLAPGPLAQVGGALARTSDRPTAVLGPSVDGGFWLLGMSQPHADAFSGVPMSDPTTGARQLDSLRRCGFDVSLAATARDVDTFEDAVAVAALAPTTMFAAAVDDLQARRRWGLTPRLGATSGRSGRPASRTGELEPSVGADR